MLNPEFVAHTPDLPGSATASESAPSSRLGCQQPRSAASPASGLTPHISSALRRAARHAEVDRDTQLVAAALLDTLRRIVSSAASQPPEQLWARVGEALAANRAAHLSLNSARITLRAHRYAAYSDSAPLPASLGPLRHHGNYRGAFASMAELGNCLRGALGITSGLSPAERTGIARDLHLCGDIWTIELDGAVHVFGRPGSTADMLLAGEKTPPDTASPPATLATQEATAP